MPSAVKYEDLGRGSTFYVGRRENGKVIRGYEKSMQLSRKQGWFRVEMELRSVNRRIPIEAVLDPAAYFAGACSYLAELADTSRVERVKTFQDATLLSLEHASHYHKVAYGPLVKFLRDIGLTDSQIVDDLTNGVTSKPRRLRIAHEDKVLRVAALAPAVMNT
jgi:phage replication initiation protein